MKDIKKLKLILLGLIATLAISACQNNPKTATAKNENQTAIFPEGQPGSSDYFTGTVNVKELLSTDSINNFSVGNVVFEPGARANWHTHPRGQVLIVTEGNGFNQEKGKPAQPIKKGDVINIPPNVLHWHGASADSKMVHIAISNYKDGKNVIWGDPVTDAEYQEANQTESKN